MDGLFVVICIDFVFGFKVFVNDLFLQKYRIIIEFGYVKNFNKNFVVERVVQELENELLCQEFFGSFVFFFIFVVVILVLNLCICLRGFFF